MQPFGQGGDNGLMCCLSLSLRMRSAGVPMHVHTGVIIPHIGDKGVITEAIVSRYRNGGREFIRDWSSFDNYSAEVDKEVNHGVPV